MRAVIILLVLLINAASASATTVKYEITFTNSNGNRIGQGSYSYDPLITQDIYVQDLYVNGVYPGQLCTPGTFGCSYSRTWTPLQSLIVDVPGVSFSFSNPLWAEGTYSFCGRYLLGSFLSGSWVGGDCSGTYNSFLDIPELGVEFYTSTFHVFGTDFFGNYINVSGNAAFTLAQVPLPASGSLMLAGLSVFGWYRRRRRLGILT